MSTATSVASGGEHSDPPISTVAGTRTAGPKGDGGRAVDAELKSPYGIAVDSLGTVYISDHGNHRIRKVTTDGKISTVAGNGSPSHKGDGGPAVSAQVSSPRDIAVDSTGAVYLADTGNHRVRKITADGMISTVAGTGVHNSTGDGGPATAARLHTPYGVAVDGEGALFIAEYGGHRVRKVAVDGTISTIAGTGSAGSGGNGGAASKAQLNRPYAVAVDGEGNLYIAEADNHRIRKVAADGTISMFAGTGNVGSGGDGGSATSAQLSGPRGMVVDSAGILYVADYGNHRVRKITPDGVISTVAGTESGTSGGFGGDGGPAVAAQLKNPTGLAVDSVDTLFIADHGNHRLRRITSSRLEGLPDAGSVVLWTSVRSRLRMAVARESLKDGAEVHQSLAAFRDSQRWRMVAAGQDGGDVLYVIENVRSGKVLEVAGAQEVAGAVIAQRSYEGGDAHHQQWRLIPVGAGSGTERAYEIANRGSGLLLRVDTNARSVIRQYGAEGDHLGRQWQLLPEIGRAHV